MEFLSTAYTHTQANSGNVEIIAHRVKIEKQFDLNAWLMLPMGEMKYNCWRC